MSTLLAPVVHLVLAGLLLAGEADLSTATPPPSADRVAAAAGPDRPAPADGVWPLTPRPDVVTGFDPPASPYSAGHRGVDLAGDPGQRVRAAVGGRVTYAGSLAGRGVVVVAHGATRTTYEPVTATVAVGELVEAGAVLGRLESGRGHCAPAVCLHWGLIEGETYLDPLTLVGAGPVRLLPLSGR
jgi:murein DD-endopeptidase MepM/ murein hydrolase activator NlpD